MARPRIRHPIEKVCKHCGKTWIAKNKYQIAKQETCSIKCRGEATWNKRSKAVRTKRDCKKCGKEMEILPCHLETKWFCSKSCGVSYNNAGPDNNFWKGGVGVTGRYWKAQARKRDGYACQYPGCSVVSKTRGTHAHHILPAHCGGEHSLENLITLCTSHHRQVDCQLKRMLGIQGDLAWSKIPIDKYNPKHVQRIAKSLVSWEDDLNLKESGETTCQI